MARSVPVRRVHSTEVSQPSRQSVQGIPKSGELLPETYCPLSLLIKRQVYKLPQLEILDLSRNKLTRLPEEIIHMKALRVLSLLNNNIGDLPPCLGLLDALKILKISGNPLTPNLMRIIDGNDGSTSPPLTALADNEKESVLTRKIKKYLKAEAAVKEGGGESR